MTVESLYVRNVHMVVRNSALKTVVLILVCFHGAQASGPIKLTSTLLALADGATFGMSGQKIGQNKRLRNKIIQMLVGIVNTTGQHVGLYRHNDLYYSVRQLARLETSGDIAKEDLETLLGQVKLDFDTKIEPFMLDAAGLKPLIFALIKESCEKRNRHGSFLLTWGEAKEDADRQLFHDRIRTFAALDEFLTHLQDFLQDLNYSCPKGCAQYEELKQKNQEAKQQQTKPDKK